MAAFLALTGEHQRVLGEGMRSSRRPARICAPRPGEDEHPAYHFPYSSQFHRLREQWQGVRGAPAQKGTLPPGLEPPWEKAREVYVLTEAHGPFEQGEGSGQVALAEEEQAAPVIGPYKTPKVIDLLGNAEPFCRESTPSANMPISAWHSARRIQEVTAGRLT